MTIIARTLIAVLLLSCAGTAQSPEDQKKIQEIRAKRDRGEQLTPEDRAFVQRMTGQKQKQKGAQNPQRAALIAEWNKTHSPKDSTGMIPLNDLGKGMYKGEQGGLYPGGANKPPAAHEKAGLKMAAAIVPLDGDGRPSSDGKIVVMSVGVSNTTMEFQTFQKLAAGDKEINPHVVLVDGAQPGQAASEAANPQSNYWKMADQRMTNAGATHKQVQVLWIKETYPLYDSQLPFPGEAKKLQGWLVDILHTTKERFPNLKIAYFSSRIYAGYAQTPANPEPFAYEFGFSEKWVIADQIAGKPELNYNPAKGAVRAPWVAWGPYMWADGVKPRSDGLVWLRPELSQNDGMHPSDLGRQKVAKLLMEFLKKDPTSRTWFLAKAK